MTVLLLAALVPACSSKKNDDSGNDTSTTNIASQVVANLTAVSQDFVPTSLESTSASVLSLRPLSDPCEGVTNFAVCQSNLIRAYIQIGKAMVDTMTQITSVVGQQLGQVADGQSGTSNNGRISFEKVDSQNWEVLFRTLGGDSVAHTSVAGSVYNLSFDQRNDADDPQDLRLQAQVTYTDAETWTVDVFMINDECDATDPGAPSRLHLKLGKANGLWTGKAMLYSPRWNAPGETVSCATATGTHEIAMYTDFVGNDTSTKAALYMIPATVNTLSSIGDYDLSDFCTNFAAYCGGAGEPTAGFLSAYTNNWCTTGPSTNPTWGDSCSSNATVSGAAFSNASLWVTPVNLKAATITLPTSVSVF